MSVFAISDLHFSYGVNKPMNVFGNIWENYEEKIKEDWLSKVKDDDFVIIPGDISWGLSFKEALCDFKVIDNLPGKKILLRGNHDYYFSTKTKLEKLFIENNLNSISILHNNAFVVENYILCGSRGWGNTEEKNRKNDKKIILREEGRLKISLDEGIKLKNQLSKKGQHNEIIVALHFPPFIGNFENIMIKYGVRICMYGHLHGYGHFMIREGNINGILHKMVSCDYTKFKLIQI